ncbi:MAG: hypothetical protein IDH49_01135 [Gammaproteobacteria bacterium]|nr:hypothetical protein [Gammaproteobacteria bacterium]
MRYIIDAWLEDGDPRLSIRDADTGAVRMQWDYERPRDAVARERAASKALQGLFRKLMLLSCADRISLPARSASPGFGAECLDCGECVAEKER